MPSLKVSTELHRNTFNHFYTDGLNASTSKTQLSLKSFGGCTQCAVTIMMVVMAHLAVYASILGLFYRFNQIYNKYQVFYVYDWVLCVLEPFVQVLLINYLFVSINISYPNSLKYIMFVSFVICICINGTFITIVSWEYHKNNNIIWYVKWFCQIFEDSLTYEYRCKIDFSLYYICTKLHGFAVCFLLTVLVNHLIYYNKSGQDNENNNMTTTTQQKTMSLLQDYHDNTNEHHNYSYSSVNQSTQVPLVDINIRTESTKTHITADNSNIGNIQTTKDSIPMNVIQNNAKNNININNNESDWTVKINYKASLLLSGSFGVVFLIFACFMLIINWTDVNTNIGGYFLALLCGMSLFKFIFKYIAGKFDTYKMNTHRVKFPISASLSDDKRNNWRDFVSMEMFIEFMINLMYYLSYYRLFFVDLADMGRDDLILVVSIHICSEIRQSTFRFSQFYFDITKSATLNLTKYIQFNHSLIANGKENNIDMPIRTAGTKVLSFVSDKIRDDSTIDEWRIRHSIDMTLRFMSFVIAFIIATVQVLIVGYTALQLSDESEFDAKIGKFFLYVFIIFCCDLVYSIIVFLFNLYIRGFNILHPFLMIYNFNHKVVIGLVAVSLMNSYAYTSAAAIKISKA